jgi:hypothetical protein
MSDHFAGYRAFGNSGQHIIVLPQYDAVLAVTSFESDDQGLLDAIWAGLLPQLEHNRRIFDKLKFVFHKKPEMAFYVLQWTINEIFIDFY